LSDFQYKFNQLFTLIKKSYGKNNKTMREREANNPAMTKRFIHRRLSQRYRQPKFQDNI